MLFRAIDTLQIEWASCLGFVAKVLNAPGNQIHLRRERGRKWDGWRKEEEWARKVSKVKKGLKTQKKVFACFCHQHRPSGASV